MLAAMSVACVLLLLGCERQSEEIPQELVRAVKTIRVAEVAGGQLRCFAGVVDAAAASQLSFAVGGKVLQIHGDLGDRVKQGQLLAELDQETYALRLARAEADLEKAQVELRDSRDDLERQSRLAETGHVSVSSLAKAQARYDGAEKSVELAQAQADLSQRDLTHTKIRAPFDGTVIARVVDVFREVQPGEIVLELEGENELEIELLIPETVINRIYPGHEVTVEFPAVLDPRVEKSTGRVSKIGRRTDEANAYPVAVSLFDPSPKIRSGMTAEVCFTFRLATDGTAYLVPINAVLPPENGMRKLSQQHKEASLFVFDEATSTVIKRPVTISHFTANEVGIQSGITEGDIIVVAGVHHLHNGQRVRLLQ